MYDELYNAIMKVDFEQAEKYFMKMSNDEQRDIITQLYFATPKCNKMQSKNVTP